MTAVLLAFVLILAPIPDGSFQVETLAGTGLPGHTDGEGARFNMPQAVLVLPGGEVVVLDTFNNLVRKVSGNVTATLSGRVLDVDQFGFPNGYLFDGELGESLFNRPIGGAVDSLGRILIADSMNHSIRVIDGERSFTLAGSGKSGHVDGASLDALFNHPSDVAFGPCGSLFVADSLNHVVRKIDIYGMVTTFAGVPGYYGFNDGELGEALFNTPMGIAVNSYGVVFVSDTGNHLIRKIYGGIVTTFAGEVIFPDDVEWEFPGDFDEEPIGGFLDGERGRFNVPQGIFVMEDILIVADAANHRIRGIRQDGYVFTIAGTGEVGSTGGSLHEATFHFPRGIYVHENTIFVADTGNNQIRMITILSAEKKITFQRDLRLLTTENTEKIWKMFSVASI